MRIAIVIDSLCKGGAERQALLSARGLACRANYVELIRYYQAAEEYDPNSAVPARSMLILKSRRPIRFVFRLARHLRRGRFDVVYALKETPCFYGCLAAWLARVPVRLAGCRTQFEHSGLNKSALRLVDRLATAWIPNSLGVSQSLVNMFGVVNERLHIVLNGIEASDWQSSVSAADARTRLGLPADAPTVAMIAALRPEKNHGMFIRMADAVHHAIPNARFLIVGDTGRSDDAAHARLREMAEACGVASRVHFLGQRSDIADVLAAVDVSVLTSDHEGLSNALLESMAAGKAVVTTDYRGADEVVTQGVDGFITPRGDAQAMADCVIRLFSDGALRARVGEQARRMVAERFSLEAMTDRLLAVYRQYLPGGGERVERPQDS